MTNKIEHARYSNIIALSIYMILVASVIVGQNLINVFGMRIATGMLIFPLTYILIAVSTELYGVKQTREIIFCTAACNCMIIIIVYLFSKIPSEKSFVGDPVLYHDFTQRISYLLTISTVAFMVSENINVMIISKLHKLTNGGMLIFRAFLSTACAIFIDTWLVFPLFLTRHNDIGAAILETLIVMGVKLAYDVLLLPVFWVTIAVIKYRSDESPHALPECARPYTSVYYLNLGGEHHK